MTVDGAANTRSISKMSPAPQKDEHLIKNECFQGLSHIMLVFLFFIPLTEAGTESHRERGAPTEFW